MCQRHERIAQSEHTIREPLVPRHTGRFRIASHGEFAPGGLVPNATGRIAYRTGDGRANVPVLRLRLGLLGLRSLLNQLHRHRVRLWLTRRTATIGDELLQQLSEPGHLLGVLIDEVGLLADLL